MIVQRPRLIQRIQRAAFTLTELVVVLVILAATAALVIPRLGFIKNQADNATGAAGGAQLASNLETYKASTGLYPLRMDSLLMSAAGAPTGVYDKFWSHASATGAAPSWLTMGDASALTITTSLAHGGLFTVMDQNSTSTDPSNSGTLQRTLGTGNFQIAVVASSGSSAIRVQTAAGYPSPDGTTSGLPATTVLVAFGVGPSNSAVGTTMASAPRFSMESADLYGRYVAIFAASTAGKPAQLRTIVDPRGQSIDFRVGEYKKAAPTRE